MDPFIAPLERSRVLPLDLPKELALPKSYDNRSPDFEGWGDEDSEAEVSFGR
jgi:hypothetical protein